MGFLLQRGKSSVEVLASELRLSALHFQLIVWHHRGVPFDNSLRMKTMLVQTVVESVDRRHMGLNTWQKQKLNLVLPTVSNHCSQHRHLPVVSSVSKAKRKLISSAYRTLHRCRCTWRRGEHPLGKTRRATSLPSASGSGPVRR